MEEVGEGIVGPIRIGDLLSRLKLHPNNMAVQVTTIFVSATPIWEPLKDTLEECMGCTIQWPRAQLKGRSGTPNVDAIHIASVFYFLESECKNTCTPPVHRR